MAGNRGERAVKILFPIKLEDCINGVNTLVNCQYCICFRKKMMFCCENKDMNITIMYALWKDYFKEDFLILRLKIMEKH